jgi:hypothetical protein
MSEFENKNGCGCGHDHDHDDCGCGHDHESMMTLTLEDDSELHCHVIGVFDVEDKQYIALLPEGEEEALIYRYSENDSEQGFELSNIDSDEEFEAAEDTLFALLEDDDEWEEDDEEYEFEDEEDDED